MAERRPVASLDRIAWGCIAAAALVFALIMTAGRPWRFFDVGGYSTAFYDEQARAFLHGHITVDPAVAGLEGFLIGNRTYFYFGPFLAVVRLPFALFGDVFVGRLTRLSLLGGFVAFGWGAHRLGLSGRSLVRSLLRGSGADGDAALDPVDVVTRADRWRHGLFMGAALASPALFLAGWVSVYDETEMWAAALALWAAVFALRFAAEPTRRLGVTAGAFVAVTMLTRISVGMGAAVGVGLIMLWSWRRARSPALWSIATMAAGLGVHMAVNVARFGSLLSVPTDRQLLHLQDARAMAWFKGNNGSYFSLRFLPTTLVHYLRPDTVRFERLVPFVRFGPRADNIGSYPVFGNTPASSLTASALALVVVAAFGLWFATRKRQWPWLFLTAGAVIGTVPTFAIGFVANRYLADMLPVVVIPGAIGAWSVGRGVSSATGRRWLTVGAVALVAWGAWSNVALAIWSQGLKRPGFTQARYAIDRAVFGTPSPSLHPMPTDRSVPRNGVVVIDGDCAGVYVAEQGEWVNLERGPGVRRLTGTWRVPDTAGRTELARTPLGTVVADTDPDAATVHYGLQQPNGEVIWEKPPLPQPAGRRVALDVVADPVNRYIAVDADGKNGFFQFAQIEGDTEGLTAVALKPDLAGTPLCDALRKGLPLVAR